MKAKTMLVRGQGTGVLTMLCPSEGCAWTQDFIGAWGMEMIRDVARGHAKTHVDPAPDPDPEPAPPAWVLVRGGRLWLRQTIADDGYQRGWTTHNLIPSGEVWTLAALDEIGIEVRGPGAW